MRRRGELDEVARCGRLAAREMHLQHAERGRLVEYARPCGGVELVGAPFKRDRIGAIGAAERTAVRELGEQAERTRRALYGCVHHFSLWRMILSETRSPLFGIMRATTL